MRTVLIDNGDCTCEKCKAHATVIEKIKITDEIIDAVGEQQEVYGIGADRDRGYWIARKTFEAAGFTVADR